MFKKYSQILSVVFVCIFGMFVTTASAIDLDEATRTVVKDSSGTITSQVGRYYMDKSKYQFVQNVKLVNEEYTINSNQLDFYSDSGHSYLFGPTTIVGDSSKIYCEHGFYDTNNDIGYFMKDSRIDYDNRIIEGDSSFLAQRTDFP